MRYLYLTGLLALVALGAVLLETAHTQPGTLLSRIQENGLGPYLVAGPMIGLLVSLHAPGSVGRFVRLYAGQGSIAARGFLTMFGFGLALLMILSATLAIAGQVAWGQNADIGRIDLLLSAAISSILFACIVAIPEELVFRGFVMNYLRWSTSALVTASAIIASAVIFAVAHNLKDPLAWLTATEFPLFVGLFVLGTLLAVAYLVTRSLWCPIGLHVALVTFDLAILREKVLSMDLSPWWLGGTEDIREAPVLWLAFAIASIVLIASRRWLRLHLAIETPFVGALTIPDVEAGRTLRESRSLSLSPIQRAELR